MVVELMAQPQRPALSPAVGGNAKPLQIRPTYVSSKSLELTAVCAIELIWQIDNRRTGVVVMRDERICP